MTEPAASVRSAPSFVEFVGLIALMMGVTAVSIDILLPAFPPIQAAFRIANPNDLQLLVYVYMIGFGVAQLVYGPVADIFGRRPVLTVGIVIYAVGCGLALVAPTENTLLAARVIQGIGAAAGRVLGLAIVRDRFDGREMARVMSLVMMVFLIVPIVAPALGSMILLVGNWHLVVVVMLTLDLVLLVWFRLRMPETLHPQYRLAFSLRGIARGIVLTATTRQSIGYATALGLMFGCIMTYVGSAQQIFDTGLYRLGGLFPIVFGAVAGSMAAATLVNSRFVRRFGMRRISHGGLVGFVLVTLLQLGAALAYGGRPPLWLFFATLAAAQFLLSLCLPNFNALAMEALGSIAGTASSFIGFYTTLLGAAVGVFVGQAFDGTVIPLGIGYAVMGAAALVCVLWTEKGRLFHPQHAPSRG